MRSVLITTAFPPQTGGIQTILFELATRWTRNEIIVLTQMSPNAEQFDGTNQLDILRQSLGWREGLFWPVNRLLSPLLAECIAFLGPARKLLRHQDTDIIQCGHIRTGLVAYLLKRQSGIPFVIYTYAQEVVKIAIPFWRLLDRALRGFVLRQADLIITISEYTRQRILEWGVDSSKVAKIPLGVDLERFIEPTDTISRLGTLDLKGKRVILTVGRLVERKGQDRVIKALPKVLEHFPDTIYLIVGDGPMRAHLRSLIDESGLNEHVVLVGEIPYDAVAPYHQSCEVFIMASRAREREGDVEGFGLVYLEANACGRPVIGGRSGGVPDAVLDGVTGLLVDPNNPDDIAAAIIELLTNRDYARQLGQNGRRRVEEEMNWDNAAARVQTILLNLARSTE